MTGEGTVKPENRARLEQRLAQFAADADARVYAVLEGALFDDLPSLLAEAGIAHRSLYRGKDHSLKVGGPWLADPYHFHPADDDLYEPDGEDSVRLKENVIARPANAARQIEAILRIVTDSRAAVFWTGDMSLTEDILYRHIRTINQILIPRKEPGETAPERVTFRHADANVMVQVVPALSAEQFVRLLGPARSILFTPHEEWSGGIKRADRPDNVNLPTGPLALTTENVTAVEQMRLGWLTARTVKYLREYGKDRAAAMPDEELEASTRIWLKSGSSYGVTQETQLRKWCYLQLFARGKLETVTGLRGFMAAPHPNPTPNERVDILMRETTKRLKAS